MKYLQLSGLLISTVLGGKRPWGCCGLQPSKPRAKVSVRNPLPAEILPKDTAAGKCTKICSVTAASEQILCKPELSSLIPSCPGCKSRNHCSVPALICSHGSSAVVCPQSPHCLLLLCAQDRAVLQNLIYAKSDCIS